MHDNNNTIAIHITNKCNLRCPLCYLEKENAVIPYEYIQMAINIFQPEYIVAFGGEAILCPDILKRFHKDYPDIKIILHTNGTIYNSDIFDICHFIYLTIESFFYKYNKIHRNMTYKQYKNFLKTISYCKNKIECIHNIYPNNNDETFFKMANLLGISYGTYPMISEERVYNIPNSVKEKMWAPSFILVDPKIRILTDGTVTRDMTGHFNICHITEYKPGMDRLMPISDTCKQCSKYKHCVSSNMFPHFCKLILDNISYKPAFCHYNID